MIAARAVVTKDVPAYQIVAGNPAGVIRARLEPGIAERLAALAWWDWDHERLHAALNDFRQATAAEFLDRHGG